MFAPAQCGYYRPAVPMLGDFASEHGQQVTGGVALAGTFVTALGIASKAAWVPVVGPAVAGVTFALSLWMSRKGPAQKVASTHIVDELEPQLQRNLEAYKAGPRTRASQYVALATFDQAFAYLRSAQACGNPELGDPGRRCISERDRGGRFDWYAAYRDPIESDPGVIDDPVTDAIVQTFPELDAGTASVISRYWLPATFIVMGIFL